MQFHLKHDSKIFTQKGEQLENHKEKQTSKTQYDQNYFTQVRFNSYKTWICKHYIYKVGKPPTWCKTIISQDKNGRISFQLEKPGPSCREAIVLHDWEERGHPGHCHHDQNDDDQNDDDENLDMCVLQLVYRREWASNMPSPV